MRRILIGLAAVAVAGPAAAQPPEKPLDPRDREIVASIPHPAEVEAMGDAVDAAVGAVLDIPVGRIADAIDRADPDRRYRRPHHPDETLRDMAGRDDPYFEERLHDEIRSATVGMGVMAQQMAVIAPELRRSLERIEDDVARAVDAARARRYAPPPPPRR